MKQMTLSTSGFDKYAKTTRRAVFLSEMERVVPWYHDVVQGPIKARDGHWLIPERPGLGVEVSEAAVAKHPFKQEIMHAGNAVLADGTIVDW